MSRAVVQNAELPVSNLVGREALAVRAGDFASAMHAQCIALPAQVVAMRRRFLFSREVTGLSIAAIVTSLTAPAAPMTGASAGNVHDNHCGESRRIV